MTRVACWLVLAEPRWPAAEFVEGLLSGLERKTRWFLRNGRDTTIRRRGNRCCVRLCGRPGGHGRTGSACGSCSACLPHVTNATEADPDRLPPPRVMRPSLVSVRRPGAAGSWASPPAPAAAPPPPGTTRCRGPALRSGCRGSPSLRTRAQPAQGLGVGGAGGRVVAEPVEERFDDTTSATGRWTVGRGITDTSVGPSARNPATGDY